MARRGRKPKTRRVQEDGQSTTVPLPPAPSPPPTIPSPEIIRYSARLAKRPPNRSTSTRSPVRNVPPVRLSPYGSSSSSPYKNIHDNAKNLNDQEEYVSNQNPHMLMVQETPGVRQPPPQQSPTISVNHTQIGEREANDDFDPDVVESINPEVPLVNVGRYRVKEEISPLFRTIIRKYGDIGEESILKTPESLVFHFERICWVYNELGHKNWKNFPIVERKRMMDVVNDAAAVNIRVDWLQKRLNEIENAYRCSKEYIAIKEKVLENSGVIARIDGELKKRKEEQAILVNELLGRKDQMNKTFGGSFVKNLLHLDE